MQDGTYLVFGIPNTSPNTSYSTVARGRGKGAWPLFPLAKDFVRAEKICFLPLPPGGSDVATK